MARLAVLGFEVQSEDEVVESVDEHRHSALVCLRGFMLSTVHSRVHRVKVEKGYRRAASTAN